MASERNETEKACIDAALAFANLRKVIDADRVYALFGTTTRLVESGAEAAAILENDRLDCEERLVTLARNVRVARRVDGKYIRDELMPKIILVGRADADARGRVTLRLTAPSGVEAGYAYALALLHDPTREWGKALRRCRLASCAKFFLALPHTSGGPTPSYCCTEHQKTADREAAAARVRKYRARKSRQAAQQAKHSKRARRIPGTQRKET